MKSLTIEEFNYRMYTLFEEEQVELEALNKLKGKYYIGVTYPKGLKSGIITLVIYSVKIQGSISKEELERYCEDIAWEVETLLGGKGKLKYQTPQGVKDLLEVRVNIQVEEEYQPEEEVKFFGLVRKVPPVEKVMKQYIIEYKEGEVSRVSEFNEVSQLV